jgi:DNA-binding beta-propeller fold protein YncE
LVRPAAALAGVVVALNLALSGSSAAGRKPDLPLEQVREIRLPGSPSRFDYQDIDPARRRLYIAHLGAGQVDVVDLERSKVVGVVRDVPAIHGVRVAPDLGIVYASATRNDTVVAIDESTLSIIGRVPTGDFPDGLAYDPDDRAVFASDKNAGNLTAFDAPVGPQARTIELAHETGNVVYDPSTMTVRAAARTPDQLAEVDPRTGAVTSRIELPGCKGAHGVYLEPDARLAFVACEDNGRLSTVDLTSNRQGETTPVGKTPDVLAYDPGLHRLYVASESGIVSVFELRGPALEKLGEAKLAAHAHSVAVDPATHRVYFPLQDVRGHPTLRIMRPTGT